MATTLSRDFIVKGVGKMLALKVSDGSVGGYLGHLGDMSVSLKLPRNAVYGGDGLWPIGFTEGDRSGSIAFTNNKFNLDQIALAAGGTVTRGTSVDIMEFDEPHMVPADTAYTVDLKYKTGAKTTAALGKVKVFFADGTPCTLVESAPAALGEYTYASGVLTFAAASASKAILVDYLHAVTASDKAGIVSTALAFPVEIYHKGIFVDDVNGAQMGLQTYAPNVMANGDFTIDWKRGSASTHKLTFDIQDPQTGANVIEFADYLVA